jgi:hypothetical protein
MCKHPEPLRNAVLRATAAGCRSPPACALAIHCRSEELVSGQGRTAGTAMNACRLRASTQQNTFQVHGIAASMRVAGRTALCIPSRPRQSHPQRWHQRAGQSALRLFGCLRPTSCASMTSLRTQPLHPGHGTSPQTCETPPCAPAAPAARGRQLAARPAAAPPIRRLCGAAEAAAAPIHATTRSHTCIQMLAPSFAHQNKASHSGTAPCFHALCGWAAGIDWRRCWVGGRLIGCHHTLAETRECPRLRCNASKLSEEARWDVPPSSAAAPWVMSTAPVLLSPGPPLFPALIGCKMTSQCLANTEDGRKRWGGGCSLVAPHPAGGRPMQPPHAANHLPPSPLSTAR